MDTVSTPATRRPRKRGRRPKTLSAVLSATSELLETVPLAELSVTQILSAAGVGRTSFYEHFTSKDDVVVKLVRSISAEVAEEIEPMFDRGTRSVDEAFLEGISNWLRTASRYRPLLVAATEEWPAVPELRRLWFRMLGDFTVRLAALIDRDRADGVAPPGADSEPLAASLVWATERSFHVAMTGYHETLTDAEAIIEPLVQLFVGSIYGRVPAQRRGRRTAATLS
jgi:TetR/AcrR family transcriptional regulator, ethionamide resistance regulator